VGATDLNYILVIVAAFVAIFLIFKYNQIKNKKDFIDKVKSHWGKRPTRDYSYEQLESIKRYSLAKRKEEFHIDDITWNDLDMNSIFKLMNNTNSSIGEQYLYHMLRTPQFDKEVLLERKRIIDFFERNEKERIELQCIYGEIGRTGNYSLSDYIYNLADLQMKSNLKEYSMLVLGILSIIAALTLPTYGVLIFVGVVIVNISQYYRKKGEVEPYFVSIAYINRLLNGADSFVKASPNEINVYVNRVRQVKKEFKTYKRHAKFVSGKQPTGDVFEVLFDYVKMFFHIDLIKFNYVLAEVKNKIDSIDELIEILGSMEAYIAIASFRGVIDYYSIPDLYEDKSARIKINDVYHPLITNPVVNSVEEEKSILITGSNASGKSTFLKTIAINAILAQTIYMTMAKKYHANFYRIYSSMALNDNLMSNESYYIVEIKSLKRILDTTKDDTPILCFIDEVLRGTNTIERIAASTQILNSLNQEHVMCFAATHDIELTHILEDIFSNYHFEEEVKDNDILFSYELKNGRATSRNAIKLLNIIGYEKEIIDKAEMSATYFMKNNRWEKLL
jgi:DNA mismatch repair ATPase MutS